MQLSPGFILVHGNQPETLRDLVVTWMRRHPLAPLDHEIILTQSNGIAQWLKAALAAESTADGGGGLGIAAGLDVTLPARFIWRIYRKVLGTGAVPETSPFDCTRLTWRLMRVLTECIHQPEYTPLRHFLRQDQDIRKRYQLAERLADLFDQYQVYRADWLTDWAAGRDQLRDARDQRQPLPAEQQWQAALWRALREDVVAAGADVHSSRATIHQAFLDRLAHCPADERPGAIPQRVIVFGISSLPRQALEALAALSQWTQILVCVHNPCENYWADIIAGQELFRAQRRQPLRAGRPAVLDAVAIDQHAQPLLATWGKQGRDFIGLLDELDNADIGQRIDLFSSPGNDCLLHQLQDDIRDLRPLRETRDQWMAVDPQQDHSIRFHTAHSPQREVEILHDQLLAAFNADPSLTPRDVIVMVPDIQHYAPSVQAVFGLLERQDPRFIPFSIADQGPRITSPLVQALELVLDLPQSRLAVSQLLDLVATPAVRERFALPANTLPQLQRWIQQANIRWGLHGDHRAALDLPADGEHTQHTWDFGLRRMLLGYALHPEAAAWHEIEPYGEIGGLDAVLAGALAALIEALETTWRLLNTPATVASWGVELRALLARFFTATDEEEAYLLLQLEQALENWAAACTEAAFNEPLPITVVREAWLSQLDATPLTQRFLGGAVTFATLMPMRAIPFRFVALLGMNDGDYPRTRIPLDFDLMSSDYRPGDRSRREDDRYLFLEALLSARERLHLSWVGRSIVDHGVRMPSVLISQLRDHLAAGWRLDSPDPDAKLLDALTTEHRLQPFSCAYVPAQPDPVWFTYAKEWHPRFTAPPSTVAALSPLVRDEPLTLNELADFLKAPIKIFFKARLGVVFERDDPVSEDQEPFDLDPLLRWQLRDELIRTLIAALDEPISLHAAHAQQLARFARRGDLAAGAFGALIADEIAGPVLPLVEQYQAARAAWQQKISTEQEIRWTLCDLDPPLAVVDWLGEQRRNDQGALTRLMVEPSDLLRDQHYRPKPLISHWVNHVAAHLDGTCLTTEIFSPDCTIALAPLTAAAAQAQMTQWLQAWTAGMCRPLPVAVNTTWAWLDSSDEARAKKIYETKDLPYDLYLQRIYPDFAQFADQAHYQHWADTLFGGLYQAVSKAAVSSPPI